MRKVFKWIGIIFGSLIGLVLLLAVGFYVKARMEFATKYQVQAEAISVPMDAASIERGHHLAVILCMECHSSDMGGDPHFFEGGALGSTAAPNLTPGKGGLTADYTNADLVRAIRHGVKPDGTSIFLMSSQNFAYLSDQDLGALIAYIRLLPPVDRPTPEPHSRLTFLGGMLYGAGAFGHLLRAPTIEQMGELPSAPEPGVTAAYGGYLVNIGGCRDCHGAQMAGGKPSAPGSPLAPNLTPGGELRAWSEADFARTLRTGVTPSGDQLENTFMPWKSKGKMTDDELQAVWMYLQSLPALPTSTAPAE